MITLSSDFGSPYPGAMKGVISQWTETQLVDVTHDLPRQDVPQSAFWLRETLPYFRPAVHLAVIDPGVGTDRDAIVVRAGDHALVGPDNGVLLPAARRIAGPECEVFRIETREEQIEGTDRTVWPPALASSTFHGRDIFAPAAARVHEIGVDSLEDDDGLSRTETYESLTLPDPAVSKGEATGCVLAVDEFGNVITNVPGEFVDGHVGESVTVDGEAVPLRRSYGAVAPGTGLVTVGSHGNVELAVNQGRGDERFALEVTDDVRLTLPTGE